MQNSNLQTEHMASVTYEICQNLYNEKGASAVYDFCNKAKLRYHYCNQCEVKTPTVESINYFSCAICGQGKNNNQ